MAMTILESDENVPARAKLFEYVSHQKNDELNDASSVVPYLP